MTSKQRAYLVKLASTLTANVQIGKAGLADNNLVQLDAMLKKYELVKISVMRNLDEDLRALANEIATNLQATVVIVIGRKIVLYRHSPELAKKGKAIILPR